MESLDTESACPQCQAAKMKSWDDLTDEEQFLAERLPGSAHFTAKERKRHRFCTRCWYEETDAASRLA
jgi:hypothetical protein